MFYVRRSTFLHHPSPLRIQTMFWLFTSYPVVWTDNLLIFWQKSYSTSQNVEKKKKTLQIIKHVELSRFKSILKLKVTFVESLFTLKTFNSRILVIFTNSDLLENEEHYLLFQIIDYAWISIMSFDLCWKW